MIEIGTIVRVKVDKSGRRHPWRQAVYSVVGRKGRVVSVRDVQPSENVPEGKIYDVSFWNGRKKVTKGFPKENLKIVRNVLTESKEDVKHNSIVEITEVQGEQNGND